MILTPCHGPAYTNRVYILHNSLYTAQVVQIPQCIQARAKRMSA
jgi:hypothetical protein